MKHNSPDILNNCLYIQIIPFGLNAPLPENNDYVSAICLPTVNDTQGETEYSFNYATGWGETYGDPFYSNVLKQTALPIVSQKNCTLNKHLDTNTTVCAGFENGEHDTCNADSGGPLMWFNRETKTWVLIGITSFGPPICGTPNKPGVYTRVSFYLPWILNIIKQDNNLI
ncbi:hypothetical protein B4U80_09967 [Leptotrombidium deliense]|uniref:Peptidase S1 domain-containing protein n=1 Tax=Leptotrombidium deliense TaxID=299467 RepID=A0A443SNP9_9ACAR|nr:hypothetical protein B4U80_09967 [Leptotrombidium deliense]